MSSASQWTASRASKKWPMEVGKLWTDARTDRTWPLTAPVRTRPSGVRKAFMGPYGHPLL